MVWNCVTEPLSDKSWQIRQWKKSRWRSCCCDSFFQLFGLLLGPRWINCSVPHPSPCFHCHHTNLMRVLWLSTFSLSIPLSLLRAIYRPSWSSVYRNKRRKRGKVKRGAWQRLSFGGIESFDHTHTEKKRLGPYVGINVHFPNDRCINSCRQKS